MIIICSVRPIKKIAIMIVAILLIAFLCLSYVTGRDLPATTEPIYHGDEESKAIALTCNVFWGEEYIGSMLEILEDKNVHITFFIGGTWAEKFPQLVRSINAKEHEIGSHGYAHPHPDRLSEEANRSDIEKAEKIISGITGNKPILYAPPYGERGNSVLAAAENMGYRTILWSIDTVDWQRPEPDVIMERVLSKAHNGGIVLMHPTAPTVKALPLIIDNLKEQGYQLITIGEMINIK